MELKRLVSIEEIESEHPYVHDTDCFHGSHSEWIEVQDEWNLFRSTVIESDEVWEFEDHNVILGFGSGEGGYLIRRDGKIIRRFVTYMDD